MMANYTTLASLGQRYQDYPQSTFNERFGPYQAPLDQDTMRRLFEYEQLRQTPEAIVPGETTIDTLGHRGIRHPSGYYMLRAI